MKTLLRTAADHGAAKRRPSFPREGNRNAASHGVQASRLMQRLIGRCVGMTSAFLVLIVFGVLTTAGPASAACRWFGTQTECDLGKTRVVLGTQVAEEPSYARSFRPQLFQGSGGLPEHETPAPPFQLELQDVGADPSLCRKIGNETYCY